MNIEIRIEISRTTIRRALAVCVPVAVLLGGSAALYANVPNQFNPGDPVSSSKVNENFAALDARISALEGSGDCPQGYANAGPAAPFLPNSIVCTKGVDEVVKVGIGGSAFWIDRYEASMWTALDGGSQVFNNSDDSSLSFPKNGQVTIPYYALSVGGAGAANYVSWFQAAEACAASGKRLATTQEWQRAARGTYDPGNNGGGALCVLNGGPRPSGNALGASQLQSCVSDWGAEDMIGNHWEYTNEWYFAVGHTGIPGEPAVDGLVPWPDASFGNDATYNILSAAIVDVAYSQGLPAVLMRGGNWVAGNGGGIFNLSLSAGLTDTSNDDGFRCVVPR